MLALFSKEVRAFFSNVTGYLVIALFLIVLGMMMWVLPDFSVFEYPYASLDSLFDVSPLVFLFLIPAVCMRSFSEEINQGTIETLYTKPLSLWQIVLGKYLGNFALVLLALIPTLIYVYTVWQLGSPKGNIDLGQIMGSYIGLIFLAAAFAAIGLLASALTPNQVSAFILAAAICFLLHYGMYYFSRLPFFSGAGDLLVQKIGIDYHYRSLSRGVIDLRDLIYFSSLIAFLLYTTYLILLKKRNG